MDSKSKLFANKFISTELQLNEIRYKGCSIGSVMAKFHSNIYRKEDNKKNNIFNLILIFKFILNGFFKSFPKKIKKNEILFNKLADIPQCNGLIDPLVKSFNNNSILFTPGIKNQINPYLFIRKTTIKSFFNLIVFLIKRINEIKQIYFRNGIFINKIELIFILIVQLTAYNNWLKFFEKSKVKLVVVDFDRQSITAPMVLAAKQKQIKTITLVHGVINPPYGYTPLLADEIWCWGKFQKLQLIDFGVTKNRIKVLGNPIVRRFNSKIKTIKKNRNITIGIALNPMGDKFNKKFIDFLRNTTNFNEFNWIVKLHPSLHKIIWMQNLESDNFCFYENRKMDSKIFFSKIDILILNNSSIGYEAVVNNIPILIYKDSEISEGHDKVMIEKGKCPDISKFQSFNTEISKLLKQDNYIGNLLKKRKIFVLNEYFDSIGQDASNNIVHELKTILTNDN